MAKLCTCAGCLRQIHLLIACVLCTALVLSSEFVAPAFAQTGQVAAPKEIILAQSERRGFNPFAPLQRLFGGKRKQRPKRNIRTNRTRSVARSAPAVVVKQKDPNAGVILVVGDRMARGVAEGLTFTFADKPQVRVEPITQDKRGFTGTNAPDWNDQILAKIRGQNVRAVVLMIGWRDMGRTFPAEEPLQFMTSGWQRTYRAKVNEIVRTVRQERKPLVWAGLPPTNQRLLNEDFMVLNEMFEAAAEDPRVRYVDIWDIFLTEDGKYTSYGSDVDGKRTRLRSKDRIGFTWSGYRKVAFFVERELSRVLGGYGGLAFEGVEDDPNFIVLTGRTTSPEGTLLGGEDDAVPNEESSAYRFFVEGESLPVVSGRVDDYRLPGIETSSTEPGGSPPG